MSKVVKFRYFFIGLATILALSITFFLGAAAARKTSGEEAIGAHAIDQAESMGAAQSALESIQRGDLETARITLENQIRQGLVILHATTPELVLGRTLSQQDLNFINDATRSAEAYAQEHKISIPPPQE